MQTSQARVNMTPPQKSAWKFSVSVLTKQGDRWVLGMDLVISNQQKVYLLPFPSRLGHGTKFIQDTLPLFHTTEESGVTALLLSTWTGNIVLGDEGTGLAKPVAQIVEERSNMRRGRSEILLPIGSQGSFIIQRRTKIVFKVEALV